MTFIDIKEITWADVRSFLVIQGGRGLCGVWWLCGYSIRSTGKLIVWIGDRICEGSQSALKYWNQLPAKVIHQNDVIDVAARLVTGTTVAVEPITDVISAIEGKQVMIIGEMGTGKSTLAQYLAYTVGGQVKVYECEGTPDDWQGLEVVGEGEDWDAINQEMAADLEDLSNQLKVRKEKGDAALNGTEKVIIVEEYPELVNKVENSEEWLDRHARRGRKARRFTILLSQYDKVSAWGLEGKSDLADAFFRIRLGKKAVKHAQSLKNEALVQWLRTDRSHCLLDDEPLQLPSYREMKAVTQRFSAPYHRLPSNYQSPTTACIESVTKEILEVPPEVGSSGLEALSGSFHGGEKALWETISALLEGGKTEYWVIQKIWGVTGGSPYQKAQTKIREMRERFGT